ncbi:MAG: STAS domain-containing protein [Thermoleophilia bacterium]
MFRRHPDKRRQAGASAQGSGQLQIRSVREGDRHIVAPAGELDLDTAHRLEAELARVEATDAATIVLDLRGLGLVDSCGMGVVIRAGARAQGARLRIVRGRDNVHRAFELSGMAKRLPFVDADPG